MAELDVQLSSPDGNIHASLSAGERIEVWFAEGSYERYTEIALEQQLVSLARLVLLARTRARREALNEALGNRLKPEIHLGGGLLGDEAFSHIPTIQTHLAPWTTAAVDRFKNAFLPGIAVALRNHITVARALRNVMAANYHLLALAREDVDGIAHDTIAALESFGDCHAPWTGDPKATLGVVAGVATIIAGVVSFPAAPPLGAAAVAGGFTVLDGTITTWLAVEESRAQADDPPLGADTVDGIVQNMAAALNTVYVKLGEGNETLRSVLSDLQGQIEDNRLACLAPRPTTLADATQDDVIEIVEG